VIGSSEGLAVPETFEEGHLRFRFDDSWYAIKYDEHPDYRERIERLDGTKAVDFVAVYLDSQLFLIEVKDFRGHRIDNQPRLREGELAIEVGQKVRDTVAGIVAAYHRGNDEDWERAVRRMGCRESPVRVILWLEQDLPPGPPGRRHNQASVLIDALRNRLQWLTPRILVVSLGTGNAPDGLQVTNLPGAGRAP
jgi:hypothetical protein